jgi:ADP-heptose:LPS heptosyltransferase
MSRFDMDQWLVVRLSALGDVTLTTGVLAHLAETRGWRFHFLTRKAYAPVLMHNPHVQKIVVPEEPGLRGAGWLSTARNLAGHYRGWGLLDLHGSLRSFFLRRFWKNTAAVYPKMRLERRIFDRIRLGWAERRLLEYNVPQRYALAVTDEAPPASELRPRVYPTPEERTWAKEKLAAAGVGENAVALHPYATHAAKAWPREHWRRLVELLDEKGQDWFVIGRTTGEALFDDHPRDMTFETDVRRTCALLEASRTLVTNDSGPMHLATAAGARVVALFGPTHRAWGFFPSGENDVVLERDMKCRPCHLHGGRGCRRGEECLRAIPPQEVLEAIL